MLGYLRRPSFIIRVEKPSLSPSNLHYLHCEFLENLSSLRLGCFTSAASIYLQNLLRLALQAHLSLSRFNSCLSTSHSVQTTEQTRTPCIPATTPSSAPRPTSPSTPLNPSSPSAPSSSLPQAVPPTSSCA